MIYKTDLTTSALGLFVICSSDWPRFIGQSGSSEGAVPLRPPDWLGFGLGLGRSHRYRAYNTAGAYYGHSTNTHMFLDYISFKIYIGLRLVQ